MSTFWKCFHYSISKRLNRSSVRTQLCASISGTDINFSNAGQSPPITSKSPYQVDKVLVADFSISVPISEGQQDFQFVGVQLRTIRCQEIPEPLRADEAWIVRVILSIDTYSWIKIDWDSFKWSRQGNGSINRSHRLNSSRYWLWAQTSYAVNKTNRAELSSHNSAIHKNAAEVHQIKDQKAQRCALLSS